MEGTIVAGGGRLSTTGATSGAGTAVSVVPGRSRSKPSVKGPSGNACGSEESELMLHSVLEFRIRSNKINAAVKFQSKQLLDLW